MHYKFEYNHYFLVLFICFFILFSFSTQSVIQTSIESTINYETPFYRYPTITITATLDNYVGVFPGTIRVKILNGSIVFEPNSLTTNIDGILSTTFPSSNFFVNQQLQYPLPYFIEVFSDSVGNLVNNTAELNYKSNYYNQQISNPVSITNETISTIAPTTSGSSPSCIIKRLIKIENPNYYQYYFMKTSAFKMLQLERNVNETSYLIQTTNSQKNIVYLTYTINEISPLFKTFNENVQCQAFTNFQSEKFESIALYGFSKSFVIFQANNRISRVETSSTSIPTPVSIFPDYFKLLTTAPSYLYYFRTYKSGVNANETIILDDHTVNITIGYPSPPGFINPSLPILDMFSMMSIFIPSSSFSYVSYNPIGGNEYLLKMKLTYQNITLIDYINVFYNGIPISTAIRPINNNYILSFNLSPLPPTSSGIDVRIYFKYTTYISNFINLNYVAPQPPLSSPTGTTFSSISLSSYSIQFTGASLLMWPEIVSISSFLITDIKFPKKIIGTVFPYGFKGTLIDFNYHPYIPRLPDTPSSVNMNIVTNTITDNISVLSANTNGLVDLIAPMAFITILYNQEIPTSPISYTDFIRVDIKEEIGIDNERCFVYYGPYIFKLFSSNRIKGGVRGDSSYLFAFNFNRYFCGSVISFVCLDLRGSDVFWSSDTIEEVQSKFLGNVSDCQTDKIVNHVNLISIDSTIVAVPSSINYGVDFSVVLQNVPSHDRFIVYLYLILQNNTTSTTPIKVTLTATQPLQQTPNGVFMYYSTTPLQNPFTTTNSFDYKLVIQDTLTQDEMELSNSELKFLSNSRATDMKFDTSITLLDPTFKGFNYIFNMVYSSSSLTVAASPALTNIKYLNISYTDNMSPYSKVIQIQPSENQNQIIVSYSVSYSYQFWLSGICDNNNNCETYSPFFCRFEGSVPGDIPAKTDFSSVSIDITPIPSVIDSSSNNRSFEINLLLSTPVFDLSTEHLPILYIVEIDSGNKLECLMNFNQNGSYSYSCAGIIPLNWGSTGVGFSIYNIITLNGDFYGFEYQIDFIDTNVIPSPKIWSFEIDSSNPRLIFIDGAYLGYLEEGTEYTPKLNNGLVKSNLKFNFINETRGYIRIPSNINIDPSLILEIGNLNFTLVNTPTCFNPTCSGHGDCLNSICHCSGDWSGIDCSINTAYTCLKNCSGHGSCDYKLCNCVEGYKGPSCETMITNNNSNTTITTNSTSPSTSFNTDGSGISDTSKQTNFTISLTKVEEVDYKGTVIHTYDLSKTKWNLQSSLNSSTTFYKYTIPVGNNNNTILTAIITVTKNTSLSIQFANQSLLIPENSIKYYLHMKNYTFGSKLNHLEFTWETQYRAPNLCEIKNQKIIYGGLDKSDIHYILIPANQLQLYGRFSNIIVVDNRTLLSSNSALEKSDRVLVKIDVPYFEEYAELDPDFSVLLDLNQKSNDSNQYDDECNLIEESNSKQSKKYFIPVIVVSSVVGLSLIVISIVMLYKKNLTFKLAIKSIFQSHHTRSVKLSNF